MPTNAISLLLFVALLLPGLAYTLVRERHRPTRSLSAFRETAQVAFVSVVADLAVIAVFLLLHHWLPDQTPDFDHLARDPSGEAAKSFSDWFAWGTALLAVATIGAAAAGTARARRWLYRVLKVPGDDPANSAWWTLFTAHPSSRIYVGIQMDDGRWIEGYLYSWARESEDVPDRELTLSGDIKIRPANSKDEPAVLQGYGTLAVSARRIQYMAVSYVKAQATVPTAPPAPKATTP